MSLTVDAGTAVTLDPSDIRVLDFNWDTQNLPAGVEIAGTATWTITLIKPTGAPLITKDNESILAGNRKARVRLNATTGQLGAQYTVACKITTNEAPPQTKEQSFKVFILNR